VIVLAIMLLLGAWEWSGFLRTSLYGWRLTFVLSITLMMSLLYFNQIAIDTAVLLLIAVVWWIFAAAWIVFFPDKDSRAMVYAGGVLVLMPMWVAFSGLAIHQTHGGQLILCLLLLVAATDIGAYFTGRAIGKHKLAPRVSPGKTWEGVIGGLLAAVLMAVMSAFWFGIAIIPFVGLSLIAAAFSIVGDLTESLFKRHAGLKDSSSILPGHGGVLDRIDSITAAAPVFVYGLMQMQVVTL